MNGLQGLKVAGAPISWGVCEVPGWGHVLPVDDVLAQMADLGLSSTELGPPGFLPDDPAALRAVLAGHRLTLVGGFLAIVLHDRDQVAASLAEAERSCAQLAAAGGEVLVLAAATGLDGYDERATLTDAQWATLIETAGAVRDVAVRHGLRITLHPHVGTHVERPAQIEAFLRDSDLPLCLDTGHLLIGGTDPLELARAHPDRITHVHLKDVSGATAARVRSGELSYQQGVRDGLYVPLGDGDVPVAEIVATLQAAGYAGWYVLEQDTALLDDDPAHAARPALDTRRSLQHLQSSQQSTQQSTQQSSQGPLLRMTQTTQTVLWNDSADPDELARSIGFGAVGATCNPVIALTVVKAHLSTWGPRIAALAEAMPTATESALGWRVVEEVSVAAAAQLRSIFEEHGGRNGRLSVQTDPRLYRDSAALVAQARHFDTLAPNIIVKIPATRAGIAAMEETTYHGISVNATVSFTVAQALAVGVAIERGLRRREAEGLDIASMGPVCTLMVGRLDDWMKAAAEQESVTLDPGYYEWAGVAAFKKAYGLFAERGYRTRLLSAAFRNHMHWSELIGGDVVISPPFGWQLRLNASGIEPVQRIERPVDPRIVGAMYSQLAEFRRAYDEDGLTVDEFDQFGATRRTLRQFLTANAQLDALVRDVLLPVGPMIA